MWRREKSSDLRFGGGLNCCLKTSFHPPGDLKPAGLATRKLDELLLSDSHMAGGMEVTVVPGLPSQIGAIQSTHPVLTEDCSWFFLSKYLQYGQSLHLKSFGLPLSHVAAWRPDRHFLQLSPVSPLLLSPGWFPEGLLHPWQRPPCWNMMCRFPDAGEEECHFTGQSGVGH